MRLDARLKYRASKPEHSERWKFKAWWFCATPKSHVDVVRYLESQLVKCERRDQTHYPLWNARGDGEQVWFRNRREVG
jgi:hypothetical protein